MCALSSVMEDSIWCNVNDKNSGLTGTGLVVVGNGACRLLGPIPTGRGPTRLTARGDKQAYRSSPRREEAICFRAKP